MTAPAGSVDVCWADTLKLLPLLRGDLCSEDELRRAAAGPCLNEVLHCKLEHGRAVSSPRCRAAGREPAEAKLAISSGAEQGSSWKPCGTAGWLGA